MLKSQELTCVLLQTGQIFITFRSGLVCFSSISPYKIFYKVALFIKN